MHYDIINLSTTNIAERTQIINSSKDSYETSRIQWKVRVFCCFFVAQGFFKMCSLGLKGVIIWTRGEFLQPKGSFFTLQNPMGQKGRKHKNLAFKTVFYISAALVCNDRAVYGNIQ